ncbi:MAG: hypothetical protein ABSE15_01245 [Candidatus Bathyarchaeia archaeon]|jgi:DNA-binding Lrp family transcriptional regulator
MTLLTKPTKQLPEKAVEILKLLSKNRKLQTFTELEKASGFTPPTISSILKQLQIEKMIIRNVMTRKYEIGKKGLDWLQKNTVADNIRNGLVVENPEASPPVNSIVAIDIPNITEAQRRVFMKGTPIVAAASFDQFFFGLQKMSDSQKMPDTGRVYYTASIDVKQTIAWLKSEEGKEYIKNKQT